MPPPPEPKPVIKESPKIISKSKIFKCMECHRGFKREIKLIKHVTRKHGRNKLPKSKSKDLSQIEKSENMAPFVIPAKPMEGALKLTPMGCPDCTLIFNSEENMLIHFTKPPHETPSQPNKCPVLTCDMNFQSREKLVQHLTYGKHGQPCPQCGKSFPKVNFTVTILTFDTTGILVCCHLIFISLLVLVVQNFAILISIDISIKIHRFVRIKA